MEIIEFSNNVAFNMTLTIYVYLSIPIFIFQGLVALIKEMR